MAIVQWRSKVALNQDSMYSPRSAKANGSEEDLSNSPHRFRAVANQIKSNQIRSDFSVQKHSGNSVSDTFWRKT